MALVTFRRQTTPFHYPRELKTPLLVCLLIVAISGLVTATSYPSIQPRIPLFYSMSSPQDQLVPKQWIFVFPLISAVMLIMNRISIQFLRKHDDIVTKIVTWTTLFLLCMLNLALIRILYVIN